MEVVFVLPSCSTDLPFFYTGLVHVASEGKAALDARLDDLLFPTCGRGGGRKAPLPSP